jgi:hypothetical protein
MTLIEKWKPTGLLDELDEQKSEKCAFVLEKIAMILISNENILNENFKIYATEERSPANFIAGTLIPIIRKLIDSEIKYIPHYKFIYSEYLSFLKNHSDLAFAIYDPDGEEEVCKIFCEYFIKHVNAL